MPKSLVGFALVLAASAVLGPLSTGASAAGPGGWDHLGDAGAPGTESLNGQVRALSSEPGNLYVGGDFTDAGGNANADRIAVWNGSTWTAVSSPTSQISNGGVFAIAVAGGKVYVGGTFVNAGGNGEADFLAVWDGANWAPVCSGGGSVVTANVHALQIIGQTLYVGGSFQNAGGIVSADYLVACDLITGTPSATVIDPSHPFSGPVHALTKDANGTLYAGGSFSQVENLDGADNVVYRNDSGWHAMGAGSGSCGCAIDGFVRSLAAVGTDVYVGTDVKDVAGIAQADNVAKWTGSSWGAVGSDTSGADGWFPASTFIYGMTTSGSALFVTGTFQNADGDPLADHVALFTGGAWQPLGSNGAGNGPWIGNGLALAVLDDRLYAGGSFTGAGGDDQAAFAAAFTLGAPETTITAGPEGLTSVREPLFHYSSSQPGSRFECQLVGDNSGLYNCDPSGFRWTSLCDCAYTFVARAINALGVADPIPATRSFQIDSTPPAVRIDGGPAEGSITGASPAFAFSAVDATAVRFQCSLDGAAAVDCSSPHTTGPLGAGQHTFEVVGVDQVGNTGRSPKRTFTVLPADTAAPRVVLSGSRTQAAGPTVAVVVSCGGEACTAVATGTVSVPGAARIFKLRATTKRLVAGRKATLKLRVPKRAQAAIRRALRHKRKVTAKITVRVKDAAGNARTSRRSVKIRR